MTFFINWHKRFTGFFVITLLVMVCSLDTSAQLKVNGADKPPYSPVSLIRDVFLGSGVTVLNVEYDGVDHAVGYFDHAENQIALNRGIVMTTGRAEFAQRPNIESNFSSHSSGTSYTDAYLINALGLDPDTPGLVRDLARYKITFIPHADSLRFNYVFASEEYPKYSCSQYKDVFGFFISGPDPEGGDYVYENIALVPGTGEVVSISTVNNGDASTLNCLPKNNHLYNDNTGSLHLTYNAYLDVFTAAVKVVPCQTYEIRLALSDIADDLFDSAVFLEAKSFATNELVADINTIAPDGNIAEGCQPAVIRFSFESELEEDYDLGLKLLTSHPGLVLATNLTDYVGFPSELVITKGNRFAEFAIEAIPDQLIEGIEWIAIEYQKNICYKDTLFIGILDNKIPQVFVQDSFFICKGDTVALKAELDAGFTLPSPMEFRSDQHFAVTPSGYPVYSPILVQGAPGNYLGERIIEKVCIDTAWTVGLHNFDFYLVSPKGKILELSTANGKRSSGGSQIDSMVNTCFIPDATNNINNGNPSLSFLDPANPKYSGNFAPEGSWSDLWPDDQQDVNGVWQMMVIHNSAFVGHLESWSISFKPDYEIHYNWTPGGNFMSCNDCRETQVFPEIATVFYVDAVDTYGCISSDSSLVEVIMLPGVSGLICDSVSTDYLRFKWDPFPQDYVLEYTLDRKDWMPATGNKIEFTNLGFSHLIRLSLRLTDGECFSDIQTVECVTFPCPAPSVQLSSIQHLDCYGDQNGAVIVQAYGTTGPYLFELNGEINYSGVFPGLAGGMDTLFVTDGEQCRIPYVFEILQPDPLVIQASIDSITCHGASDGSITLEAEGGNGNYSYLWSGPVNASGHTAAFTDLSPGTYIIRVSDSNACSSDLVIELTDPPVMVIQANISDVLCKSVPTGSISVVVSGGYGDFKYNWLSENFTSDRSLLEQLNGGWYSLTVTDAGNCSVDTVFWVIEPDRELNASIYGIDTMCYAGTGAFLYVEIDGGTPPYQTLWQNGATGLSITELEAGQYSVLVRDQNECTVIERKEVVRLPRLTVEYDAFRPDCAGRPNGSLVLSDAVYGNVQADITSMHFEWNSHPKQHTGNAYFLRGNQNYDLKIVDKFGCDYTFRIFLEDPPPMTLELVDLQEVSCYGSSDGRLEVSISGGQPPYQYHWSANAVNADGPAAEALSAGYYWLTVTDAVFCTSNFNVLIPGPIPVSTLTMVEDVACHGDNTGSIKVDITGGTPPYSVWWNGKKGTSDLMDLPAGKYFLEVRDFRGCMQSDSFTVEQPGLPLRLTAESVDPACAGSADGEISVWPEGGILPYMYKIDQRSWQSSNTFYGLKTGTYAVIVSDGNSCEEKLEGITVSDGESLFVDPGSDTSIYFGERIRLDPIVTGAHTDDLTYQWFCQDMSILSCDDCPRPFVTPSDPVTVFVEVRNGRDCIAGNSIRINVLLNRYIHVPGAFSPNEDQLNDVLQVFGSPGTMVKEFKVFDSWGKKLFEMNNFAVNQAGIGWDGRYNNIGLNPGVYYWYAEAIHEDLSTTVHEGSVLLIK